MEEVLGRLHTLVEDAERSPLTKEAIELGVEVVDTLGENIPY